MSLYDIVLDSVAPVTDSFGGPLALDKLPAIWYNGAVAHTIATVGKVQLSLRYGLLKLVATERFELSRDAYTSQRFPRPPRLPLRHVAVCYLTGEDECLARSLASSCCSLVPHGVSHSIRPDTHKHYLFVC